MQSPFDALRFGPFLADYHRRLATARFRSALSSFLEETVTPQMTRACTRVEGHVTATFNDERHTGPHSAVRNLFDVQLTVYHADSEAYLTACVRVAPESMTFSPRREPPYLWTPERIARSRADEAVILELCRRLAEGASDSEECPRCRAAVEAGIDPSCVSVICPTGCFYYDYHRVPETGEYVHGHFFLREPP